MKSSGALLAISLAALGCDQDERLTLYPTYDAACAAIAGCGETRFPTSGRTERIFRVVVARAPDGAVRIGGVEEIDVAEDVGVPVGPPRGTHVIAGRDASGAPIDGQMLAFPETLLLESFGASFVHEEVSLAEREVDRVVYVRALPEVVDVAVLALDGSELVSAPLPTDAAEPREVGRSAAPLIATSSACAHVQLLDGEADRALATNVAFASEVELVSPGPAQRATVDAALGMMPPLLCHTISRIAFGRVPAMPELKGAVMVAGGGDTILVNVGYVDEAPFAREPFSEAGLTLASSRALLTRTLLHESGHSVAALLQSQGARPDVSAGGWIPAARSLAADTIAHVRIESGLVAEWQRMHDSFVEQGWAEPYAFDDARGPWNAQQTAHAGAMTRYGSTRVGDDICDMIALPTTASLFAAAGVPEGRHLREDFGCQALRAYSGGDLPADLAAVYTKLRFLQDLGLLADADADACIGTGVALSAPVVGMEFQQGSGSTRSYTEDIESGLYVVSGAAPDTYTYQLTAGGSAVFGDTTHAARASLTLFLGLAAVSDIEEISWPRGVYEISPATPHTFELELPDEPAGSFAVDDGFALVARGSGSIVVGSVFIRRAMRWGAPVPVPQTFDPPLVVSFRYE